ncbi:MAG: hypothetical protein AVDCRST_MAG14-1157 [uncultured Rubrobacteraceae bacterium]|uniref:Uncharacterized protein n=1 Tax=uncultured Rubrobacteraceae bacterium TaxID=349277 RepID=A0A6J4QRF4_9ACTN|nr:MAG: hypothetical protein AVDCRST_MAG14-1157 [uncultured Rubrobacteraceae bacterium]
MQVLGMPLLPSSINLPLDISFPIYSRPRLDVTAWGKGVPDAARGPVLAIKAVNVTGAPVEITDVYAGFMYVSSLPAEVVFGSRTVKLPLHELTGKLQPPCVLQAGESALWTANLRQLTDDLEEKRLTLAPHSRFLNLSRTDSDRWTRFGRPAIMVRNVIAMQSQRKLAVVISDGRDGLHKAKVRWQPPLWATLTRRRFPSVVTEVEIFEDLLVLHPRGAKGVSLSIDLANVVNVRADPEVARSRAEDTDVLGIVPEEPRHPEGDDTFFNVNEPDKTIVIVLRNERYARLVIEVEEPQATVAAIWEAVG